MPSIYDHRFARTCALHEQLDDYFYMSVSYAEGQQVTDLFLWLSAAVLL